ncbi:hypothetical protein BpHYR1_028099 [Brachionus plicatilis]|uniref:Uncharacterized protein n=1 Tax=Brachionus plicatilis TaxID=10195 RepID=A0A3M7QLK0_BRAPC|nr:hypothetical protein BpHYR1_028099 [Brachionus plicatilis]
MFIFQKIRFFLNLINNNNDDNLSIFYSSRRSFSSIFSSNSSNLTQRSLHRVDFLPLCNRFIDKRIELVKSQIIN